MSVLVRPSRATLGARVEDLNLAQLSDEEWNALEDAFHEHAVLVFPAQHLSPEEQVDFARRFGEIEHVVESAESVPISNQRRDGSIRDADDPAMQIIRGTMEWHTDSSYRSLAAKASVLSARMVAESGGETEWADMRAAFEALDPDLRDRVGRLSARHSYAYSQSRAGFGNRSFSYGFDVAEEPLRPLVKVHPATGRPALFIGRHAHAIPGMDEEESQALLDELLAFACRPPRVLSHRWQTGDVVVWDNRCVLHRARPWDLSQPRSMLHTRIAGDPRSELAAER